MDDQLGFYVNPYLFHKDDYDKYDSWLETRIEDEYMFLEVIGEGGYGTVYIGCEKKTNEIVAIKEELEGLSRSTIMEINILKSLPPHPSIVAFKKARIEGSRVFVVMEYLNYDLKRLRAATARPFSLVQMKFLVQQILKGVKFLHDNGVMHRDLKPSNILFDGKNKVKICDFGLSARAGRACGRVGTRGYIAPEVLAGSSNTNPGGMHTCAVDMWAVGCIMAGFVLDQPLFHGRSDAEELACIRDVLCSPNNMLRFEMVMAASFAGATQLSPSGYDLLERLLAYDPCNRISATDALDHAWFKE